MSPFGPFSSDGEYLIGDIIKTDDEEDDEEERKRSQGQQRKALTLKNDDGSVDDLVDLSGDLAKFGLKKKTTTLSIPAAKRCLLLQHGGQGASHRHPRSSSETQGKGKGR